MKPIRPIAFYRSRKHTREKGILNWKKCEFIIVKNEVRRAANTPDPPPPLPLLPSASRHINPSHTPTHSAPSDHRPIQTPGIQTQTCHVFTPLCVSSPEPSPGSCRTTGSSKTGELCRGLDFDKKKIKNRHLILEMDHKIMCLSDLRHCHGNKEILHWCTTVIIVVKWSESCFTELLELLQASTYFPTTSFTWLLTRAT